MITRVLAANVIPEGKPTPELIKKLDEQDPESAPPKLSIEERQWLLMQLLKQEGGLDELAQWMPELARKFEQMLMEYHNIFSLDKNEIGCMDASEHIIKLLDEEPFKEKFWQIAPPFLDEVQEHLQEMLDGGAIRPSQSPWCNVVVLVQKKDGDSSSALTSGDSMLGPRRIPTLFHACRRLWNPWSEPGSFL